MMRIQNGKASFLIKAVISALVLTVLIKTIHLENIWLALRESRKLFIALAFALLLPNGLLQLAKWHFLLRFAKPTVSWRESLASLLMGFTLGFITPGRVGEFSRAFFVTECKPSKVVGATLVERLYSFTMIAALGSLGLLTFARDLMSRPTFTAIVGGLVGLAFLLLVATLNPKIWKSLARCATRYLPLRRETSRALRSFGGFRGRHALILLGIAFLSVTTYLFQFYLLVWAFENVPLIRGIAAAASTLFVKGFLPISLGDLGVRESASVFFFSRIGVSAAVAFDSSLLLFTINVLLPSIVGLVLLLRNNLWASFLTNAKVTKASDAKQPLQTTP